MDHTPQTIIVVPCYNEAARLSVDAFRDFAAAHPDVRFLFVNDGSVDDTTIVLESLAAQDPACFEHLDLEVNVGKAEAVRLGMLRALASGCRYAGYWDADLATPLREITRFVELLEERPERDMCFGSRVNLLGRHIERRALRHYVGRLFATIASLLLRLPVYDTQCGAKLFRATDDVQALFETPFCVNWTFDVELIARLQQRLALRDHRTAADVIYELPLDEWRDVAGSKVSAADFFRALLEMFKLALRYRRRALGSV